MNPWYTYSGETIDFSNFTVDKVRLPDIARSLSHQCRFGGHVAEFYSVAQHSVLVAERLRRWNMNPITVRWGLMHDAAEAYITDVPRPIKAIMQVGVESYRTIEARLLEVIADAFGLPPWIPEPVWNADRDLLYAEALALQPKAGELWVPELAECGDLPTIQPWTPKEAYRAFFDLFNQLFASREEAA